MTPSARLRELLARLFKAHAHPIGTRDCFTCADQAEVRALVEGLAAERDALRKQNETYAAADYSALHGEELPVEPSEAAIDAYIHSVTGGAPEFMAYERAILAEGLRAAYAAERTAPARVDPRAS